MKIFFRSETLRFEFALFNTGYNAIIDRPAYVKFMALPSYAYLQLKMLGRNDTIFVHGSAERALVAGVTNVELRKATLASVELKEIKKYVNPATTTLPCKPRPGPTFQPTKET